MPVIPVAVACFAALVIGAALLAAVNRARENFVNAAGPHGDPGFARNQPTETTVNAAGAHGDPGTKEKACPPRYRKPPVDQKEA